MELITADILLLGALLFTSIMLTYLGVSYIRFVRDMENRYAALKRSSDERDSQLAQLKKDLGTK